MAHQHSPRFLKIVQDAKARVRELTVDQVKAKQERTAAPQRTINDSIPVCDHCVLQKKKGVQSFLLTLPSKASRYLNETRRRFRPRPIRQQANSPLSNPSPSESGHGHLGDQRR